MVGRAYALINKKDKDFYDGERWLNLRSSILRRDKYKCQMCLLEHQNRDAVYVHHIFPREHYPQYEYEPFNLISLCAKCHNEMHDRFRDQLSKKGTKLMRATAAVNGIDLRRQKETILVIGLRGHGKTTYCQKIMDNDTLVYDLDAIASAFRLKTSHEEYHNAARKMANDFLFGFIAKAHDYVDKVIIIRTAPTIKEVEQIKPDKIVICTHEYLCRPMDNKTAAMMRIKEVEEYAKANYLKIEILK